MEKILQDRLVEATVAYYAGDRKPVEELAKIMGVEIEDRDGVLILDGIVRTGIFPGLDPVTLYVCLAFAFCGVWWTEIVGEGLEEVKQRWKVGLSVPSSTSQPQLELF